MTAIYLMKEAELLKFETLEVRDKTNDRLAEAVARA